MELYIIIVAGGRGTRADKDIPKQFVEIAGKPLLIHTFEAFSDWYSRARFILVLPEMEIGRWKHVRHNYGFEVQHILTEGGPTRFHSVKNGLAHVPDGVLVAIHDAARPLVSSDTIKNCLRAASLHGSAVPVVPVNESLRYFEKGVSKAVDRSKYVTVQTPQVFGSREIKKAYNRVYDESFTDDASVFEAYGKQIVTIEGNGENIKITQPADFAFAEFVLLQRQLS